MKRQSGVSPVLIELLVVALFFAVCASINLQLLAKANSISRQSERQSAAMLAAGDLCERIRSDPAGFGPFDQNGLCEWEAEEGGITLQARIQGSPAGAGVYYEYAVTALEDGEQLAALSGGSYRREAGR